MLRGFLTVCSLYVLGCCTSAVHTSGFALNGGSPEALAGTRAAPALEAQYGGVVRDAEAEHRMESVGRRLTHGPPRRFPILELSSGCKYRLLDSKRLDAVSLPRGRIYITRALYAQLSTDDLLAAVLAHEMAHLEAKDHLAPRAANPTCALSIELSSDVRATQLLEAAGFRSAALVDVLRLVACAQPADWANVRIANLSVRSTSLSRDHPELCFK